MKSKIQPLSLKDAPSLIEYVLPAQKVSAESYKEQMAVRGKTLTALGSYWKGRKPLILNRACVLGALLPVTQPMTPESLELDLEIFEKLMAIDDAAVAKRRGEDTPNLLPDEPYSDLISIASRPEECSSDLYEDIWSDVNKHLGTNASSFPDLVEQLGVMRFGHRPRVADTFCGSGQIPFEAARLGCDVYASDLNPVACMLTWGAFGVVGASASRRETLEKAQTAVVNRVQAEIDELDIEQDNPRRRPKVFLYCLEVTCPETGWSVPLLPTRVISKAKNTVAYLVPDKRHKRYEIEIRSGVSERELKEAVVGTVQNGVMVHEVNGREYRTSISTLRGDYQAKDGTTKNRLRSWSRSDVVAREDDIYRERLYAIQWVVTKKIKGKDKTITEFASVTSDDLRREKKVTEYVQTRLTEWQRKGWVPDLLIESGEKTDEPIRTRGWSHWHHLFNPRQLVLAAAINRHSAAEQKFGLTQVLNMSCRLSRVDTSPAGGGATKGVFDNQALNPLFAYGCRSSWYALSTLVLGFKSSPLPPGINITLENLPADQIAVENDIFITDPPYGDAVKYEEILEFFIAWLRKNPPPEFGSWVWDSRRALAIKGEDDDFRRGMVAAYKRMTELMPENGLQIIMFTHQSGSIWADMANIVWASGLHVTAAWYVVTETDSALREGSYVKGTVLLVLRKRQGQLKTGRDDLAWEIQEEVQSQVDTLTGLNQTLQGRSRAPNQFSDADLQMAGYAAALRVLTRYSIIDGKAMADEALRPRQRGIATLVDDLIDFAVGVANNTLVPRPLTKSVWDKLGPSERFYLKMLDQEARGHKELDNYQNFAKAFKVKEFKPLMASTKANSARLKSAVELGRAEMSGESELANTGLRAVLYGIMELVKETDGDDVLTHLSLNVPDYFAQRPMLAEISGYLAVQLERLREEEASAARILRDLVANQKL